jgi:hypothetical protein
VTPHRRIWINNTTSTVTDRFQYGYDRNDNALYRKNAVKPSSVSTITPTAPATATTR